MKVDMNRIRVLARVAGFKEVDIENVAERLASHIRKFATEELHHLQVYWPSEEEKVKDEEPRKTLNPEALKEIMFLAGALIDLVIEHEGMTRSI